MNKETDDARWQGETDTKIEQMLMRIARIEKSILGAVLVLAGLYLRSIGVLP